MDAAQVNRAFAWAERNYSCTPCRKCRSTRTDALIYEGVVMVSCEDCGGATPKGRLTRRPQSSA